MSFVLGPAEPDLEQTWDLTWDLTWELDLDLSLTICVYSEVGEGMSVFMRSGRCLDPISVFYVRQGGQRTVVQYKCTQHISMIFLKDFFNASSLG